SALATRARASQAQALGFGVAGLPRVLGPLLVLGFLTAARYGLASVMHVNLLRLAVALASSFALIRIAFFLLRRVFARAGQVGAAIVTFERVFALLVWLAVALYITGLWPDVEHYLTHTTVPLGPKNDVELLTILKAVASVAVLLILAMWAGKALDDRLMRLDALNLSARVVLARVSRALLIVVAVLASLRMVGIDLTVLSVFGGALGVGLGLGLQKIASNYVSGFVILLERSLKIGDMIAVDKYTGKVTQINTRYTVLQALDGTEAVLPNEMLISGAVQNFSLSSPTQRVATQITVAFETDVRTLLPLLADACRGIPRVLDEPAPGASLLRIGATGFELDVGMWISDPQNGSGGVLSEANMRIWKVLQDQGVKLPRAAQDIRWVESEFAAEMMRPRQASPSE
ncbi:mechanosensitive ion channel, partial [Massilia arenosa]